MYRTPPSAGPSCDRHAAAPAVSRCAACAARVCTPCALLVGLAVLCPPCARTARGRAGTARRALALTLLVGMTALLALAWPAPSHWPFRCETVRRALEVQAHAAAERCDPLAYVAIADRLGCELERPLDSMLLGDGAPMCTRDVALLARAFQLRLAVADVSASLALADALIAVEPMVGAHYRRRALAHRINGDHALANADLYRAAALDQVAAGSALSPLRGLSPR